MPIRYLNGAATRTARGLILGLAFSMAASHGSFPSQAHETQHSNTHYPHTNRRESCEERRRETEHAIVSLKDGSFSGGSCVCEVCVAPS